MSAFKVESKVVAREAPQDASLSRQTTSNNVCKTTRDTDTRSHSQRNSSKVKFSHSEATGPPQSVSNLSVTLTPAGSVSAEQQFQYPDNSCLDMDEVFTMTISDHLRANFFGKDAASQVDQSYMLDLKRTEQKVTDIAKDLKQWKRDLMLAREGIIASYEQEVEKRSSNLVHNLSSKVSELEQLHLERMETLRRSYRTQLSDALATAWHSAQKGQFVHKQMRNPDDVVKIMRLEQATTRMQANNRMLSTRLEETNHMAEDLRKKTELLELALSKEKKRAAEYEALKTSAAESPSSASKKGGRVKRKKSSSSVAAKTHNEEDAQSARSSKSPSKRKVSKSVTMKLDSESDVRTEVASLKEDDNVSVVSKEGFGLDKGTDSGLVEGSFTSSNERIAEKFRERESDMINLKKENSRMRTKIQWLEERLKNASESSNMVTETLNDLHAKYKSQSKRLKEAEKEVEDLKQVINEERNEKHLEVAMIKDQLEAQRLMEVQSLKQELDAFLADRTQLSREEVLKLMRSRTDMEKQLNKERQEKRKESQVLLHQQLKLKKQVMGLKQDLKDNDRMWMKKFNALQHSYHAIREEYHLREALKRQFKMTQKIDLVRNGSSTMSKSVIQQPNLSTVSSNALLRSPVSSLSNSVDDDLNKLSKLGSSNRPVIGGQDTVHVDDYSDDEYHAEYSYLSLIKEVAEPSELSSRPPEMVEEEEEGTGGDGDDFDDGEDGVDEGFEKSHDLDGMLVEEEYSYCHITAANTHDNSVVDVSEDCQ